MSNTAVDTPTLTEEQTRLIKKMNALVTIGLEWELNSNQRLTLRRLRDRLGKTGYDWTRDEVIKSRYTVYALVGEGKRWLDTLLDLTPLTPEQLVLIAEINRLTRTHNEVGRTQKEYELRNNLTDALHATKYDWVRGEVMRQYQGKKSGEAETIPLTNHQNTVITRINELVTKHHEGKFTSLELQEHRDLMHELDQTGYDWRRTEVLRYNK